MHLTRQKISGNDNGSIIFVGFLTYLTTMSVSSRFASGCITWLLRGSNRGVFWLTTARTEPSSAWGDRAIRVVLYDARRDAVPPRFRVRVRPARAGRRRGPPRRRAQPEPV